MVIWKILEIIMIVVACFFVITFLIYFFNLDMKLMASLIKPLTKYYDWSRDRREKKNSKAKDSKEK